ncbi:sensor histidine kinase [Treponema sp. Marseille-Q4132]|uniref:sensor histidine kinase n=1 Tax=Treponema sp. Marseille-Q4132 TaxID=2766701 RepID=UPI0016533D23|nr:sensor histidine kinase [Treponema sp. Marseille-Q4132]QNL97001.1 sensor histidine kinase [Treponema sp. Marseille-Q4132]
MNNNMHFKEEIRRSFIAYSLIPSIAFASVVIVTSVLVWNVNLYRTLARENKKTSSVLSAAVASYGNFIEEKKLAPEKIIFDDASSLSGAYTVLKEFIHTQKITADFTLLSPSYAVVLKGSADDDFIVPEWQNQFTWGALGRMREKPDQTVIELSSEYNTGGKTEIVIGRAIGAQNGIGGYIVFTIGEKDIRAYFNPALPFAITDAKGTLFASSFPHAANVFGKLADDYRSDRRYYFTENEAVFRETTTGGIFDVYTFQNTQQMRSAFLIIVLTTLSVLALVIAGLLVSARKIAEKESRSLTQIADLCGEVERGNLAERLAASGNIEFQKIANAYNDMLDTVQRLIDENKKETHERYVAEIKQLEMQFNPHFLYNTLENIKFLIKLDPDKAQKTILRLSDLLRYSIDNDASTAAIGEDIRRIEHYLYILKLRFGKKFAYEIDVPDEVQNCVVPKLIIQPLIDNSVKHGFGDKERMKVSIGAHTVGKKLHIVVSDDGAGMDESELKAIRKLIRAQSNKTNHIGLYNVERRIELLYGRGYGMTIDSVAGAGTTVRISLPVTRSKI